MDIKRFPIDCIKKNPFYLLVILYHGLGQHKKANKKNTNIVPFQNILYYLEVKTNKAKSD